MRLIVRSTRALSYRDNNNNNQRASEWARGPHRLHLPRQPAGYCGEGQRDAISCKHKKREMKKRRARARCVAPDAHAEGDCTLWMNGSGRFMHLFFRPQSNFRRDERVDLSWKFENWGSTNELFLDIPALCGCRAGICLLHTGMHQNKLTGAALNDGSTCVKYEMEKVEHAPKVVCGWRIGPNAVFKRW